MPKSRKPFSFHVKDYGGNQYLHQRGKSINIANTTPYKCRDCCRIQYVTFLEIRRASSIRCSDCGGMLDPSPSDQNEIKDWANAKPHHRICQGCDAAFDDPCALAFHLEGKDSCLGRYASSLVKIEDVLVIKDTLYVHSQARPTLSKLTAIDSKGSLVVIIEHAHRRGIIRLIADLLGEDFELFIFKT